MEESEIIETFFRYGCIGQNGEALPLRNCRKIYALYQQEINSGICSPCQIKSVKKKYEYRIKEFLKIDKEKKVNPLPHHSPYYLKDEDSSDPIGLYWKAPKS
jgi:hypothetical protein